MTLIARPHVLKSTHKNRENEWIDDEDRVEAQGYDLILCSQFVFLGIYGDLTQSNPLIGLFWVEINIYGHNYEQLFLGNTLRSRDFYDTLDFFNDIFMISMGILCCVGVCLWELFLLGG